jgi:hypothetical protein
LRRRSELTLAPRGAGFAASHARASAFTIRRLGGRAGGGTIAVSVV